MDGLWKNGSNKSLYKDLASIVQRFENLKYNGMTILFIIMKMSVSKFKRINYIDAS